MDPKKITELANLLRNNGDKILNSEFKLTLSGFLLRALNDSFTLIADQSELCSPQSFQVVKPNNSKSDVFRDLQLVHDFVQKTILLCITQNAGDDYFDGVIDITKFRNLKRLEVQKTNVKLIIGIQPLRAQLQQLVCVRSLNCIEDIITHCGGDKSNGFVWNELRIADFSYNNLKTVDCSLEFAQYLQNLNLSHNQLVSVEAIKWLPNLKTLDLSFNRLANIPSFHLESLKRLQIFNLSNNFIEDLSGISKLDSLNELDLSNNCLLDHTYLAPIAALITLKGLSLYGNPLQYHPKHRFATAQFLHKNTSTVEFILDMEPLSKNERLVTGKYHLTGYTTRYPQKTVSQPITDLRLINQTPASSVGSVSSLKLNELNAGDSIFSSTKIKKNPKVRMVVIENTDQKYLKTKDKTHPHSQSLKFNSLDKNLMEVNEDHLNAKKEIEDLRDKFGAGWLQNENAPNMFFLNTPNLRLSTSKKAKQHVFDDDDINKEFKASESSQIANTLQTFIPIIKENDVTVNVKQSMSIEREGTSYVSNNEESDYFSKTVDGSNSKYQDSDLNLLDIYSNNLEQEEDLSEAENNEITYIVHQQNNSQESLFLVVSDTSIKEKDVLTKRTKTKWSLKILESCECISSNILRINFDTIISVKKERVYTVEENLCKKLENYLKGILSQRALSEMNQMLYCCVNCSCQFSREKQRKNFEIRCPDCKSIFVVESNNVQTKEQSPFVLTCNKNKEEKFEIHKNITRKSTKIVQNVGTATSSSDKNICIDEHSPQGSSIGSATSLNESSSCSKISNSDSSVESNQSVAGRSSNERELYAKNCDSDVEIISNPSVSSIEVLEEKSSSRKTSEERRLSQTPNLATIYDGIENISVHNENDNINLKKSDLPSDFIEEKKTLLSHINLTESSSSGSVTDSICTAYEQEDKSADLTSNVESRRATTIDQSIISSMLGLFTSTNMLMSKQKTSACSQLLDESGFEKYKFNNVDFNDVDHRLKLYFYQFKFNDENEHLKWLVRGQIYYESTSQLYNGIVALSTSKLYLFEIFASENDDIGKWLRQIFNVSVNQINCIQLLPWKIGVSFQFNDVSGFLLILQDNLRTDTLLEFLEKKNLPSGVKINYQQSENISKKLNYSSGSHQINILSVLNNCEIVATDNSSKMYSPSIMFTTNNSIYLTSSNFSWLSQYSGTCIELSSTQLMINVVDVEKNEPNLISLFFLDETHNTKEIWRCEFETKDNADSCLRAIEESWEKYFGVPLFR